MKSDYKETFDRVELEAEARERIRKELSSRLLENQKEESHMKENRKPIKKRRTYILVAAAIMTLMLAGFAFGNKIIPMLGGGQIEEGKAGGGEDYVAITMSSDNAPIEVRDGQIYFVADQSNRNITEECSLDNYYEYEMVDEEGYRHVVVVGGTPGHMGWGEWVFEKNGNAKGASWSYEDKQEPAWLTKAKAAFASETE